MDSNEKKLHRGFGLWASLALVIGTVIGSGIFFKQGSVLSSAGGTTAGLLAWLVGGILTLASGLSIAELGSQMTKTGGIFQYIGHIYGKTWGFLTGWMQVIFYGPAMMGAIATYFSYLCLGLFGLPQKYSLILSAVTLMFIGLLNSIPNRFSAGFQIVTTIIKLLPVLALVIFGFFFGQNDAFGQVVHQVSNSGGGFGVAILATLFAYDGWVTLANISGEIKNPRQTLPKAIVLGIVLVIFAYVGVTYGVYQSLPANQIISFGENATLRVAQEAFGEFGGRLLSITILVSLLGTLNGKVVSFPRVLFAMANEGIFPFAKTFAKINMRSRTPNAAIWLMIMIAIVMMAVADPNRLSDIAIFTTFLFYIMAFVGVIKLRRHNTMGVKPGFSTPFFPMIPLVAIAGSLYVEISEIYYDFYGVVISLLIVAVGYPIYLYLKRH